MSGMNLRCSEALARERPGYAVGRHGGITRLDQGLLQVGEAAQIPVHSGQLEDAGSAPFAAITTRSSRPSSATRLCARNTAWSPAESQNSVRLISNTTTGSWPLVAKQNGP